MTYLKDGKLIDDGKETYFLGKVPHIDINSTALRKTNKKLPGFRHKRQYTDTWEIKNNFLFLKEVKGGYELIDEKEIEAKWVTGIFRVYILDREINARERMSCFFQQEKIIKVKNGRINNFVIINSSQNQIITPIKLRFLDDFGLKGLDYYFDDRWDEVHIVNEIKDNLLKLEKKNPDRKNEIESILNEFSVQKIPMP